MAFTDFGHVAIQLTDKLGVTTSMPVYIELDGTKTLNAVYADLTSLCTAIDGASDSLLGIVTLNIQAPVVRTGWKTVPAATAENERTGLFNLSQSGSPYKFGIDLPAIADSLITGGKIDLAASAITNLINAFTVPFSTYEVVSTSIRQVLALVDALITFRKHRKAESRRSFEVS